MMMKKISFLLIAVMALFASSCGWRNAQENLEEAGEAIVDAADSVAGAVAQGAENVADAFKDKLPPKGVYEGNVAQEDGTSSRYSLKLNSDGTATLDVTAENADSSESYDYTITDETLGIFTFTPKSGEGKALKICAAKDDDGSFLVVLPSDVTEIPAAAEFKNILRFVE